MPQNIPAIQFLKAGSTEGLSGPGFVTSYASLGADTTNLATGKVEKQILAHGREN